MRRLGQTILVILMVFNLQAVALAETHAYVENPDAGWDPKGTDVHMAYEWATFNPHAPEKHGPGAVLSAPGDTYRYTALRADKYAGNPEYEVLRAIVGVHIDSSNPEKPGKKWARITINGVARTFVVMIPADTRQPASTHHVEIISDAQLTGNPGSSVPPFVFDVTDIMVRGEDVAVETTNLRSNGHIEGEAAFGGFVINRIGVHVWYKKK